MKKLIFLLSLLCFCVAGVFVESFAFAEKIESKKKAVADQEEFFRPTEKLIKREKPPPDFGKKPLAKPKGIQRVRSSNFNYQIWEIKK